MIKPLDVQPEIDHILEKMEATREEYNKATSLESMKIYRESFERLEDKLFSLYVKKKSRNWIEKVFKNFRKKNPLT